MQLQEWAKSTAGIKKKRRFLTEPTPFRFCFQYKAVRTGLESHLEHNMLHIWYHYGITNLLFISPMISTTSYTNHC